MKSAPLVDAFLVRELLDRVTFAGRSGFVASDIVTSDKHTVNGNDLPRLEQGDIPDDDVSNVDDHLGSASNDFDSTVFTFLVELFELTFLLPIVDGSDENDDGDGDTNGYTFDPIDLWIGTALGWGTVLVIERVVGGGTEILVETQSKGYDRSDGK